MRDYSNVISEINGISLKEPIVWSPRNNETRKDGRRISDLSSLPLSKRIAIMKICDTQKKEYFATIDGHIVSICKGEHRTIRYLKKRIRGSGTPRVWINGHNKKVDELIIAAFYSLWFGKGEKYEDRKVTIYHKDGDLRNVRLSNLCILFRMN